MTLEKIFLNRQYVYKREMKSQLKRKSSEFQSDDSLYVPSKFSLLKMKKQVQDDQNPQDGGRMLITRSQISKYELQQQELKELREFKMKIQRQNMQKLQKRKQKLQRRRQRRMQQRQQIRKQQNIEENYRKNRRKKNMKQLEILKRRYEELNFGLQYEIQQFRLYGKQYRDEKQWFYYQQHLLSSSKKVHDRINLEQPIKQQLHGRKFHEEKEFDQKDDSNDRQAYNDEDKLQNHDHHTQKRYEFGHDNLLCPQETQQSNQREQQAGFFKKSFQKQSQYGVNQAVQTEQLQEGQYLILYNYSEKIDTQVKAKQPLPHEADSSLQSGEYLDSI